MGRKLWKLGLTGYISEFAPRHRLYDWTVASSDQPVRGNREGVLQNEVETLQSSLVCSMGKSDDQSEFGID